MQHVCHSCQKMAEIPDYRAKRSDYVCRPCFNIHATRRALARGPRPVAVHSTLAEREKYQRITADPALRQKLFARKATMSLVRRGKLVRLPCEVCGAAEVEAHHDDYSKPRDVRWLCPAHHREHHRNAA